MNLNCAVGRQSTDNVVLQAMDQADTRSASLIAENTTLKTRHDEFKRLTEDLQLKLGDAMSAKEEMRVREKLRDLDQQSELDSATTEVSHTVCFLLPLTLCHSHIVYLVAARSLCIWQALSKDQRASQAMAQCRALTIIRSKTRNHQSTPRLRMTECSNNQKRLASCRTSANTISTNYTNTKRYRRRWVRCLQGQEAVGSRTEQLK